MTAVGIDFGTTNSVLATYSASGPEVLEMDTPPADWAELGFGRVLPTVMGIDSEMRPVFGWAAKTLPGNLPAVKRLFLQEEIATVNGQTFVVEEVATMLFAHMKKRAAEQGVDATQAVVTIPANSRGLARFRTKLTAGMAGMEVLALINEPTAAAMAFSARMPFDQRIMVVDWGGGTLDVTILQADSGVFIEQASKGIQQLGGIEMDNRVAQRVIASVTDAQTWTAAERVLFRLAIEKAKIRLTTQEFTNVELPRGGNFRLERSQFEQDVRPLVERVRQPIEQTLKDVDSDPGSIDAVILVGGTCKIPLVRNVIGEILGKDPVAGVDPMTAIAEGAALAAAILNGQAPDNDFFVATEHALGTYTLDMTSPVRTFSTIIPRNHKLPATATEVYFPVSEETTQVTLDVVEGDPDTLETHEDNVILKSWPIEIDASRESIEDKAFEITYEYDVDGILKVTVTDRLTGDLILQDDVSFGASHDKRNLVQIAKRSHDAILGGQVESSASSATDLDPHTSELLQRARTKVIPFLDDVDANGIRNMVKGVEASSGAERASAAAALESALQPFSYLF